MQTTSSLRIALLGLALAATSCKHYSTVSEKRPSYHAVTPAGHLIVDGLRHPAKEPRAQIGP